MFSRTCTGTYQKTWRCESTLHDDRCGCSTWIGMSTCCMKHKQSQCLVHVVLTLRMSTLSLAGYGLQLGLREVSGRITLFRDLKIAARSARSPSCKQKSKIEAQQETTESRSWLPSLLIVTLPLGCLKQGLVLGVLPWLCC